MEQNQQELRHIANQAFLQSLGQLEKTLSLPEEAKSKGAKPEEIMSEAALPEETKLHNMANKSPDRCPPDLDLEALEAAAADIEQVMQTRTRKTETIND